MSVVATAPYTTATGNGVATSFPFAFACRNVADVAVYVNGVVQNAGITVTLGGDFNSGTVAFTTPPALGAAIIIASVPSLAQQIQFENAGAYNPITVDGMADAAAIRSIYLAGLIARSALVPIGEVMAAIPAKASRIGKFFGFDAGGNPAALSGTGNDSALRTDLAASSGSSLAGFISYGTGAVSRTVQAKLRDTLSLKDFGAMEDGVVDDSTAFANATAVGPVFGPLGNLKTSSLPTTFSCFSFGGTFSGSAPVDGPYPAFGAGVFRAITKGTINCLVGIAHNNSASNTNAEPVGVTGYGRVDNTGNIAFGMFGRADLYATTGVATNEFDSFNYGAAPNVANLPPNRAIGTTQSLPIGLTVAAGGNFNSLIGIHICREGSAPQAFLVGQYIAPDACVNYGLVIDAVAASTFVPAVIKHGVGAIGFQLQGVGTPVAANSAFVYVDGNGVTQWSLKQNGAVVGQGMTSASGGIGYSTGAGSATTQLTSRTTGVTLNKACGQITLFSAAGSATWQTFTVTNSTVAATDVIRLNQASGTDKYMLHVTHVGAGTFDVTFATTGGTTTEQPVFNFAVLKAVAA